MKPAIVIENLNLGIHNADLQASAERLEKGKTYRDLSTIIICPTRGMLSDRVVQSWMGLIRPMNQKCIGPIFFRGYEVGEAYNMAFNFILSNPVLSTWKYVLTIEEDNLPPPDGLIRLYESMDDYDCVGGLYWTKGEGGQPMIYGDPAVEELNFIPQIPKPDTVQPANGLGMGFNLWKLDMFKDERIEKPWFKTLNDFIPGQGAKVYTQDLYFFERAGKVGYKFACDTRVKVGHLDPQTDIVW
jgi:glycosyltransferase involved in cell wall biosynthesis